MWRCSELSTHVLITLAAASANGKSPLNYSNTDLISIGVFEKIRELKRSQEISRFSACLRLCEHGAGPKSFAKAFDGQRAIV